MSVLLHERKGRSWDDEGKLLNKCAEKKGGEEKKSVEGITRELWEKLGCFAANSSGVWREGV